jgi:hypothetical protein
MRVSTGTICVDGQAQTTQIRCSACELELILTSVIQDAAPGFERHSFVCIACDAKVSRVFMRNGREDDPEPTSVYHVAPSIVPALTAQEEHNAGQGILGRLMARLLRY